MFESYTHLLMNCSASFRILAFLQRVITTLIRLANSQAEDYQKVSFGKEKRPGRYLQPVLLALRIHRQNR